MDKLCLKILWYVLSFICSFIIFALFIVILYALGAGFVFKYLPFIAILSSTIGILIFNIKYRDCFNSIMVFISLLAINFSILLCGPFIVERSLSCFVYFEAYENGSVSKSSIKQDYLDGFVQKRFDDGVKGGFLQKVDDDKYISTTKGMVFYYIYHTIGILTNTLNNYEKFANRNQND